MTWNAAYKASAGLPLLGTGTSGQLAFVEFTTRDGTTWVQTKSSGWVS